MRRKISLMENWIFSCKGQGEMVNLPHTWNAIDGADGGNDYYRGVCTYIKELPCPDFDAQSEVVYLEFNGVNSSAKVFINDTELCTHDGGYSTFRVNVTEYLKENNTIKVEVDNSYRSDVYPQKADFTFYGGIYRQVNWLIVDKYHFEVENWGTPGIHITPELKDGVALVGVVAELDLMNGDFNPEDDDFMVAISLYDMENKLLQSITCDVNPSDKKTSGVFTLENPHLWNGLEDPYLYSATASLYRGTELLDLVGADFGVRSFKIDSKRGFILNGKSYPLHGVSRHQDRKGYGNAISYEMMEEDMELIKEVGANTIRLAHYQHDQYFYDLCDRVGMIVWAEIPYISAYLADGDKNTHDQMTELIVQNYNHPSIVTWGLSNEITIDYAKSKGRNIKNHISLNNLVHELDPSRPTSMACFAMCTPFHKVTKIADVIGWNLYLGWYVPGFFLNDMFMWFFHLIRPKVPLCYSEYGAEGMPNLHAEEFLRGDNTEEYQAKYHEYMIKCFERHPFLWATYVWNMFDFAADARDQGGEPGMNHKGLVTYDRKIKKDSFYLYKAYWSNEKFVHICSKRFEYRALKLLPIKVYSNEKKVTLYVDGKEFATKEGDKIFHFIVPIDEETKITVVAGEQTDEAVFRFTLEPHPEYKLQKKPKDNTANWM